MTFIGRLCGYRIVFSSAAKKSLKKVPIEYRQKIERKLEFLIKGSENLGVKKLAGRELPTFRMRVGTYRVIFEIIEKEITVLVVAVGHRKEIYRG